MAFLGMRGTGDWVTNQRPENWRQGILLLYPNGKAPLTAMTSMLPSEPTNDPKFHWWTKTLPDQGGVITGVYTDSGLSSAYTGSGAKDGTLYVKMAEALAKEFRSGHQVRFTRTGDYRYNTTARVIAASVLNGASSYVTVKLNEADDATYDAQYSAGVSRLEIIGSMHEEGATIPDSVGYDPVEYSNVTQIFRTSLKLTRTARKTRLRTGDAKKEMKREALELHSIEMEKSLLWGVLYEGTGPNGKPLRASQGLYRFVEANASANIKSFELDSSTDYAGTTWIEAGEDWIDEQCENLFRYGDTEKLGLCGTGALRGINRLIKAGAQMTLTPKTASYGLAVIEWMTPFGTLFLKTHPLFSHNPSLRNDIMVLEPKNLKARVIDDTFFKEDNSDTENTNNSRDSTEEEFLTELGYEYHHPLTFGYLAGIGKDNTQ